MPHVAALTTGADSTVRLSRTTLSGVDNHDPDDEDTDRRHLPTPAQVRHHRRTVPGGIPVLEPLDPTPNPDAELDINWPVAPDRHDAEVLRRGGRDPDDPVRPAEVSAILRQIVKRLRDEFGASADLEKRVATLERDIDPVRRIGRWAAGAALAAIVAVGGFLYQRGRDEQHVTDELQRLTTLVDKLETKIEQQPGTRP